MGLIYILEDKNHPKKYQKITPGRGVCGSLLDPFGEHPPYRIGAPDRRQFLGTIKLQPSIPPLKKNPHIITSPHYKIRDVNSIIFLHPIKLATCCMPRKRSPILQRPLFLQLRLLRKCLCLVGSFLGPFDLK